MQERRDKGTGRAPGGGRPGTAAALALYAALAVALTWPLAAHIADRVPAGGNDLWQGYWNFWWWKTALVDRGAIPYSTDLLYQPGTVSLAFHTHSEANVLGTLPLLLAAGIPAAMNAALLAGFILGGWGAYLLLREIVEDRRAAFLGGVVFAFFPQHFEQSLEHLNLASYHGMPFFLLFLRRLARQGGWKNAVLTGTFFAATALLSWHNGLLILFTGTALLLFEARRAGRLAPALAGAAAAAAVAAVLVAPFAGAMFREILAGETYYLKPEVGKGLDPALFVIPAERHPFWGGLVRPLHETLQAYPSAGSAAYLGLAAIALAAVSLLRAGTRRAVTLLWAGLLALHLVLALGDRLRIAGTDTGIPLPFEILEHIPIIETVRVANRFLVPAMLALSVLAALGARAILERLPGSRGRAAFAGLLAIIVLDYLWLPYPLREPPRPEWVEKVKGLSEVLLLDIPGGHRARGAEDMYLQTLHGRPIAGGYTACIPPWVEERVAGLPFLQLIFEGRPELPPDFDVERELRRTLEELPIGIAVIHLDRTREALEAHAERDRERGGTRLHNPERGIPARRLDEIRAALGRLWERIHADPSAEVFRRPKGP